METICANDMLAMKTDKRMHESTIPERKNDIEEE